MSSDASESGSAGSEAIQAAVQKILGVGVDGLGVFKGAEALVAEIRANGAEGEDAVRRIIALHTRLVGATGFATGLGGVLTLPITIPTDVATFYALAARCAASVAYARGYDVASDEVRSVILLSLLGSAGAGIAAEVGAQIGTKSAMAALRKLPGKVLIEINKKVGFRLFTKFGEKGAINLFKLVPLVGGGVGAVVNVGAMRTVGKYAKRNFPNS